jgi:ArsR family transcriptional regulator, arsenate/arsenite/antimonite-responsive transcriptional repressor
MDRQLRELDTLFKALADPTRLRIVGLLLTGEVCVCHIHDSLKILQPKASRHLAYLRRAGIVETRRDGLWIYYRLSTRANPVLGAVEDAVRHALTHSASVRHDLERLQKESGCCLPAAASAAQPGCCAPVESGTATSVS